MKIAKIKVHMFDEARIPTQWEEDHTITGDDNADLHHKIETFKENYEYNMQDGRFETYMSSTIVSITVYTLTGEEDWA